MDAATLLASSELLAAAQRFERVHLEVRAEMSTTPRREQVSQTSMKTAVFDLLRSPIMRPNLERLWLKVTSGRPYRGLRAKLTPNSHRYQMPSWREIERYGYQWNVDISDLAGWYLYFGFVDPSHDSFVAECRPGEVVLDVGANIGVTALRAARAVGRTGWVYAFEPDRASFQACQRHASENHVSNLEVIEEALGEKAGFAVIEIRDPHNRAMNRIGRYPTPISAGASAKVATIDDFVTGRRMERLDVIKIDAEGSEAAVLRGGRATLERFRPTLFLEIDDALLADQEESVTGLLSFLRGLEYEVTRAGSGEVVSQSAAFANVHFDVVCRHPGRHQIVRDRA